MKNTTTTTVPTAQEVEAVVADWQMGGAGFHSVVRTILAHMGLPHDEDDVRLAVRTFVAVRDLTGVAR